jgi:hypothetical protein
MSEFPSAMEARLSMRAALDGSTSGLLCIRLPPAQHPIPMKTALLLALALPLHADERRNLAEDDASDPAYKSEWKTGASGGSGFRGWTLRTLKSGGGEAHAGGYIADGEHTARLNGIVIRKKAFALFANGHGFEAATAFRSLKKPLAVGETFSFLLEHDAIERKFDRDASGGGAIGLVLRTGHTSDDVAAYHHGARFEFGVYEGRATYSLYDGEATHDTGIPLTDAGLSVSFTLLTPDTYELEITTLATRNVTKLPPRKLGGAAGTRIGSFTIFNRDGEKSDAFFNGFQVK